MKLNLLGTSGVAPIPRPTCFCEICVEAREKGIPYKRTGPSLFLYDAEMLFDMPEETKEQLNREKIKKVSRVILTHWHPDHTLGIRALEQLNWNFAERKPYSEPIEVYISRHQYELFKKFSCGGFLDHYVKKGFIKIIFLEHKEMLTFGHITIEPIIIKHTKGFYYIIKDTKRNTTAVYAPCEYYGFEVDPNLRNVDLFIAHNLFWEDPTVSPRKSAPEEEDTFEQMLEHGKEMNAKRIIITHIEETFQLGHDQMNAVFKQKYSHAPVEAGYDGQQFTL